MSTHGDRIRRSRQLEASLSDGERAEITTSADELGVTMAELMRERMFGQVNPEHPIKSIEFLSKKCQQARQSDSSIRAMKRTRCLEL